MSDNNILQSKHIELVSTLLEQLESDSKWNVMKGNDGNFSQLVNKSYAAESFNTLFSTLETHKENNLCTAKDLRIAALYAGNTADEIKKSALWDVSAPATLSFLVALFGYFLLIKMNYITPESVITVFMVSGFLALIGAGFRAFLAHRRSQTLKQSIRYSQVEKFIKSFL